VTLLSLSSAEFRARFISNSLLEALIDRGWPRCVRPLQTQPSDKEFPLRLSFSVRSPTAASTGVQLQTIWRQTTMCTQAVATQDSSELHDILQPHHETSTKRFESHVCVNPHLAKLEARCARAISADRGSKITKGARFPHTPLPLKIFNALRVGINGGRRYSQSRRSGSHWSPYTVTLLLSTIKCTPFVIRNKTI
jgi:hypothetical protein